MNLFDKNGKKIYLGFDRSGFSRLISNDVNKSFIEVIEDFCKDEGLDLKHFVLTKENLTQEQITELESQASELVKKLNALLNAVFKDDKYVHALLTENGWKLKIETAVEGEVSVIAQKIYPIEDDM